MLMCMVKINFDENIDKLIMVQQFIEKLFIFKAITQKKELIWIFR